MVTYTRGGIEYYIMIVNDIVVVMFILYLFINYDFEVVKVWSDATHFIFIFCFINLFLEILRTLHQLFTFTFQCNGENFLTAFKICQTD